MAKSVQSVIGLAGGGRLLLFRFWYEGNLSIYVWPVGQGI